MDLLAQLGIEDPRPLLSVDRAAVESWLGVRLPSAYWELTRRGAVVIGNGVVVEGPDRRHFGMLPWAKRDLRTELRGRGTAPPPLHPAPGGLLPWGRTFNHGPSAHLLWNTADADPERWTVVVCAPDRPEPLFDSGLTLTAFLEAVVLDRVGSLGPLPATAHPHWEVSEQWSPPPVRELSPAEREFALHGPAGVPALRLLVPPPGPRAHDWERVFAGLGTELPSYYVELMDVYGGGCWAEWLSLYPPGLLPGLPGRIGRSVPGPCWPEPGGFLVVGCDIDNNRLGWLTTGPDPDAWPLVVRPRHVRGEVPLPGGLVATLVGWLRGGVDVEGLPGLDPEDDPFECAGFDPWPAD